MKNYPKKKIKNILINFLCIASVTSAIFSSTSLVSGANSSSVLGTKAALGSPILNETATLDNWNKWEMICWGVYLSNWCQPLIDNYESAFKSGSLVGSDGAGYVGLCFGSGSDPENNKTIQNFCDFAIEQQKGTKDDIFVAYTHISRGSDMSTEITNYTVESPDLDVANTLRTATIKDFFFGDIPSGVNSADVNTIETSIELVSGEINPYYGATDGQGAHSVTSIKDAYVPTFYVLRNNKYVKILDFMDSWDLQAFVSIVNSIIVNNNELTATNSYSEVFKSNFEAYMNDNAPVALDCFANIVMKQDGKMLFPSCNNQNITKEKKINLLNSWLMNNVTTQSSDELVKNLHQTTNNTLFNIQINDTSTNGLPALGKSTISDSVFVYYDSDSIMYKNNSTEYSEMLQQLFSCDITKSNNPIPLEYEVAGLGGNSGRFGLFSMGNNVSEIEKDAIASSVLLNFTQQIESQTGKDVLHKILTSDGSEISLFDEQIAIAVQVVDEKSDAAFKNGGELRRYFNWIYQSYTSGAKVAELVSGYTTIDDLRADSNKNHDMYEIYKSCGGDYEKIDSIANFINVDNNFNESIIPDTARLIVAYTPSNVMASVSRILGRTLGQTDVDSQFNIYCTMIYMTYLDWYGVINQETVSTGTDKTSDFNPEIFDSNSALLNVDPSTIAPIVSEEDMESEVLSMGYLMLSPEKGRDYRKTLLYNGISDFIYEQYSRMVFGGSNGASTGTSTKTNSGFLAVPTLSDNIIVSVLLDNYVDLSVIIILISVLLILIIGILKKRKLSWFLLCILTIVNVVIIAPSTGEIAPAVTSKISQKIFANKMTFWEVSECITNSEIEADSVTSSRDYSDLTAEESALVTSIVKNLSSVYTDRSLMLKQDLSQKLTQNLEGVYSNIQSIPSARWLLPTLMQQFSANEQENMGNYVYIPLSNVLDDCSNIYWYYNPTEALSTTKPTATSQQFIGTYDNVNGVYTTDRPASVVKDFDKKLYRQSMYNVTPDVVDCYEDYTLDYTKNNGVCYNNSNTSAPTIQKSSDETEINYVNYSYVLHGNNLEELTHLYSYLLHDNDTRVRLSRKDVFGDDYSDYKDAESWKKYINKVNDPSGSSLHTVDGWRTDKDGEYAYEDISDTYDRTDASTLKDGYGYYKATESPIYYFFNVVKDCFNSTDTVASVIAKIQGHLEVNDSGNSVPDDIYTYDEEIRSNFMYATATPTKQHDPEGYAQNNGLGCKYTTFTRDVLDLEHLFTNTIPYLYEMTLISGGFDNESGILKDMTITDEHVYYEGMPQAWAYRCNWAQKIMVNPNYSKPTRIKDADGNSYDIKNPLFPDCYPDERPMIFSEAQMYAYGLTEEDLNLVELKCIEVNKNTVKDWTLLLNYASTDGITKEILYRVMATSATSEFCKTFSGSGILDNKYDLYPQSIDLRYLSFDSVIKLIIMNVTKNTNYSYGNTMSTLISDSDLLTAFLLLVCCFICVVVISFLQHLIIAVIFILGFVSIFRSITSKAEYKCRIAMAQVISNVIFTAYTSVYYLIISALISITSKDEVLTIDTVKANPGNPIWAILIVIVASLLYSFLMAEHTFFCLKHSDDMGAGVIEFVTHSLIGKLTNGITSVRDNITKFVYNNNDNGSTSDDISGTGSKDKETIDTNIVSSDEILETTNSAEDDSIEEIYNDNNESGYTSTKSEQTFDTVTVSDIDSEIKRGEEIENK